MKTLILIPFFLYGVVVMAQPVVKAIRLNNETYTYTPDSAIVTEFSKKNLSIEFQALSSDSAKLWLRLLNTDTAWQASPYPVFNIMGLSGGEYTLEAREEGGAGTGKVLQIPIRVQQAFWQKWWFWPSVVIYFLLLLGVAVYLFVLYDFRQKLKLQDVRSRIASDLHDEVGSNLNSIAIFTELLRKKVSADPGLLPILDRITSNSEETVALMRDTVWAINPENDSTEKLIERMRSFGVEILAASGIPFDFSVQEAKNSNDLTMEQRRNLYLAYKEAVNNIAKHSAAKHAECIIKKEEGILTIRIRDDGKGFDPAAAFEGNGLRNFSSRSREENMRIAVHSSPGMGTTVAIEVEI